MSISCTRNKSYSVERHLLIVKGLEDDLGLPSIYDIVRKELQKLKTAPAPVTTRQARKKATPQKAEAAAASSSKQIKEAEAPVQIEAEYLQGGTDEKAVAYR